MFKLYCFVEMDGEWEFYGFWPSAGAAKIRAEEIEIEALEWHDRGHEFVGSYVGTNEPVYRIERG